MPYFYNNEVNILFIHIPKTGGTSVEKYFEGKYKIELSKESLYTTNPKDFFNEISYQHQTIKTIRNNKNIFRIDYSDVEIYTIVRNPYTRLMSDLFFKNLIKESFSSEHVNDVIKKYISDADNTKHDNHRIPQYMFLLNENDELFENVRIMKTENLKETMTNTYGYTDFDHFDQVSTVRNKNYFSYLNYDSIGLINDFYDKDFSYFGYKKIISKRLLNYNRLVDEIKLSNKFINKYISNYLNCEGDNINEEEIMDQKKNILFLINQNYEENMKKIKNIPLKNEK
jgi:hypothetical protein